MIAPSKCIFITLIQVVHSFILFLFSLSLALSLSLLGKLSRNKPICSVWDAGNLSSLLLYCSICFCRLYHASVLDHKQNENTYAWQLGWKRWTRLKTASHWNRNLLNDGTIFCTAKNCQNQESNVGTGDIHHLNKRSGYSIASTWSISAAASAIARVQ